MFYRIVKGLFELYIMNLSASAGEGNRAIIID